MHVFIDIDGTLCWCNLPVFLSECNAQFDLGIDQVRLDAIEDKTSFFALPEVQALRTTHPYLDDEMTWVGYRERCLLESLLMDGAVKGVRHLSQYGNIHYCTARYCDLEDWQAEIEYATTQWLKQHKFPDWSYIDYCDQISGKIQFLLQKARNERIILVDDSYISIIQEIGRLALSDQQLLHERLLLVAIRAEASDIPTTSLNVVSLPSWNNLEKIGERIQRHGQITTETTQYATATETTQYATATDAYDPKYRTAIT